MKFSRSRIVVPMLFLLLLAGCGQSEAPSPEPPEVVVSVIERETVRIANDLPGRVASLIAAEVRPQVDGIIQERLFAEGADVTKGQALYQIDPALHQAAYNTAKASLEEAEANVVALARLEKRYSHLVKSNAVSRQELDNAIADHGQGRARVSRAKAELESAAINLAYTRIDAPVSGRIGRSAVTVGALVSANQPQALALIQQTGQVYVDIMQSSADMLRFRRAAAKGGAGASGGSARVRLILEDGAPYVLSSDAGDTDAPKWIEGELLFSEISVGQTTGSVTIRAVVDNPEGLLLPGMYVRAIIEEGVVENAILVPQGSVQPDGSGGHYVFVVSEGDSPVVSRRGVTIERTLGARLLLRSGLDGGERLIVEGLQKAVPGEAVRPVLAASASLASSGRARERLR